MTVESMLEKITRTSAAVARPHSGPGVAEQGEEKKGRRRKVSKQKERFKLIQEQLFPKARKGPLARQRREQVAE